MVDYKLVYLVWEAFLQSFIKMQLNRNINWAIPFLETFTPVHEKTSTRSFSETLEIIYFYPSIEQWITVVFRKYMSYNSEDAWSRPACINMEKFKKQNVE